MGNEGMLLEIPYILYMKDRAKSMGCLSHLDFLALRSTISHQELNEGV